MNSNEQIFLTRDGKVLGPITRLALDELRNTGEIVKYFWLWDGTTPTWIPANAAPPIPQRLETLVRPDTQQPIAATFDELDGVDTEDPSYPKPDAPKIPTQRPIEPAAQYFGKSILALCHDYRNVMGGKLMQASAQGCLFLAPTQTSALPPFRKGNRVFLNLLEESSGRSENVPTEVTGCVRRRDGEWEFTMSWERMPEILVSSVPKSENKS